MEGLESVRVAQLHFARVAALRAEECLAVMNNTALDLRERVTRATRKELDYQRACRQARTAGEIARGERKLAVA